MSTYELNWCWSFGGVFAFGYVLDTKQVSMARFWARDSLEVCNASRGRAEYVEKMVG